jgi:hypothetical protein
MPGTVVRDALAPNLAVGATLNAAGTTNGTVVDLGEMHEVQIELATATVTGTGPTLNVELQGSDSPTFATGNVSYGRFAQVGDEDNIRRQLQVFISKRYIRAVVVVAGTTPVFTGTTITPVLEHDRRVRLTTTA